MLLIVKVPTTLVADTASEGSRSFFKEMAYGFRYLFERSSLLGVQMVFFFGNFFFSIAFSLITPMVLARTGGNATILGSTQTAGAIGGLLGSLVLTAWGGSQKTHPWRSHWLDFIGLIRSFLIWNHRISAGLAGGEFPRDAG